MMEKLVNYALLTLDPSSVLPNMSEGVLSMETYLDCGMYLVFCGVFAYCFEQMEDFIKDQGLSQQFEQMTNTHLSKIESLRLDWCKTKYLPNNQWVAENEIRVSRNIPFLYGLFFMNLKCPTWTNTPKNTEAVIQQRVHSLRVMICILMSPHNPEEIEIEEHGKMFLSCYHRFSRSYFAADKIPFCANTGNFPTLLCLGKHHKRHGPIR